MSQGQNRRQHARFSADIKVDLITKNGIIESQKTRDISFGGLFLETSTLLGIGEDCQVMITLKDNNELIIEAQGHVVRQEPSGIAIQFDKLIDSQSFLQLKNLIVSDEANRALFDGEIHRNSS